MLAVGHPSPAAIRPTAATTTTITHLPVVDPASSIFSNPSLDLPQGDQPVPPFRDGTPPLPHHWKASTNRTMHVQARFGKYLEMLPNGQTLGVSEPTRFSLFMLMSHVSFLVIKGFVSDKYLCMNNVTTELYASVALNESCYLNESTRSSNLVFFFSHCRVGRKRCTLGMYRNGTMQLGSDARQSRETAQWLSKPVGDKVLEDARRYKEEIEKNGWKRQSEGRRREQRRKRARRWCVQLDVMVKRPTKYLQRCKRDCKLLQDMLENSQRYMRRCLQRMVRRRRKMKALKSPMLVPTLEPQQLRTRVRKMWPKRHAIFSRLRKRRCSKIEDRKKKQRCRFTESRRDERRRGKRKTPSRSFTDLHGQAGPGVTGLGSRTEDVTFPTSSQSVRHSHSKETTEPLHRHRRGVQEERTSISVLLRPLTSR